MKNSRRTHINDRLRTNFADSGRVAGIGISYDRYDDESGLPVFDHGCVAVKLPSDTLSQSERDALNGPVITLTRR